MGFLGFFSKLLVYSFEQPTQLSWLFKAATVAKVCQASFRVFDSEKNRVSLQGHRYRNMFSSAASRASAAIGRQKPSNRCPSSLPVFGLRSWITRRMQRYLEDCKHVRFVYHALSSVVKGRSVVFSLSHWGRMWDSTATKYFCKLLKYQSSLPKHSMIFISLLPW